MQPCGGSVVGTWKATTSCVNNTTMSMDSGCTTARFTAYNTKIDGTLAFNADLTYSTQATLTGSVTINLPAECLTFNGITFTCDQFDQIFQMQVQSSPDMFQSARCVAAGSACNCTLALAAQTIAESGTYTTAGTTLTETPTGGAAHGGEYCVQGNELHAIQTMPVAMGSMGMAMITSDLVAVKQ